MKATRGTGVEIERRCGINRSKGKNYRNNEKEM